VSDTNLHYDFTALLDLTRPELHVELALAHSALANLCVQVAYLKAEEIRGSEGAKIRRLEAEGLRDAYTEKKWLIKTLLDRGE